MLNDCVCSSPFRTEYHMWSRIYTPPPPPPPAPPLASGCTTLVFQLSSTKLPKRYTASDTVTPSTKQRSTRRRRPDVQPHSVRDVHCVVGEVPLTALAHIPVVAVPAVSVHTARQPR